jgi:hypothetical protein
LSDGLFSNLPTQVSADRQIECLQRELRFRGRVFKRRVEEGRMSQDSMNDEIAAMAAALETVKLAKAKGLVA